MLVGSIQTKSSMKDGNIEARSPLTISLPPLTDPN